ncbi:hypothetical protein NAPIS_ORF01976 [Vairimorpha apis BRL 01]|uniref:Uncharacterized protein n=1 Tax=Vairimorpha apis BRL 01 TaxID=1037528 RepID=T0KYZ0_9MICR|nr:hypothetical protein NAPIS_ORF01976 [Vairimorpha apis BRL 01]
MITKIIYFIHVFCVKTPNIFDTAPVSSDIPNQIKETEAVVIQPGNKIDIKPNTKETSELEIKNDSDQSENLSVCDESNEDIDSENSNDLDSTVKNKLNNISREAEMLSKMAKELKNYKN